ncbi:hypothetical protein CCR75_004864 [Bremia lactucae]|uniref:Uncharacterized protein n=1 Tax=Bremia lactucae TaxID=4779 RepID=A0A976IIS7_BRELC|nr:hypothetical protein CCR75_004864 [Bremia lactucae]
MKRSYASTKLTQSAPTRALIIYYETHVFFYNSNLSSHSVIDLFFLVCSRGHAHFTPKTLYKAEDETEHHSREQRTVGLALEVCGAFDRREELLVVDDVALLVDEASVRAYLAGNTGGLETGRANGHGVVDKS